MHNIISKLPYQDPFLFVEEIESIDENGVVGYYTFRKDEYFYQGHFPGNPLTPGVILTEVAAQIGLVSLGIYLKNSSNVSGVMPVFSSANVDFLKPVYPGERVIVKSEKEYFRFSKLKCRFEMTNDNGEMICKGNLSGMITERSVDAA